MRKGIIRYINIPYQTRYSEISLLNPSSDNSIWTLKSSKSFVDIEGPEDNSLAHPNFLSNQKILPSVS
jgi:hypothetical protein